MIAARRRRETPRDLEHRCDHQIAAAFFRREQARRVPASSSSCRRRRERRSRDAAALAWLFVGFWHDPVTGRRLQRATRAELATAYRLWAKHGDVRTGRRQAA